MVAFHCQDCCLQTNPRSQTALALKCISAVEGNRSEDSVAAHRLDDVEADVGEDPLHVVVDRLPVLLDVPVPRLVHQAASVGSVDMVFDPSVWDAPLVGVRVKTLNNSL